MKKLLFGFILLLLAVVVGFLIHRDPGYVLVTYDTWSIETSLWVAVVIIILLFLATGFLLHLFHHTTRLGTNFRIWNKQRLENRANNLTNKAFDALIEMRWKQAEGLFSKSASNSVSPVINFTAAAYAAQQLSAFGRRDKYLKKLVQQIQSAKKTAALVQSYFYLHSNQWKEALTHLTTLNAQHPSDPAVLRFLAKTYEGLNDWDALKNLLPQLSHTLDENEYKPLEVKTYTALIEKAIHPEWLDQVWSSVPKSLSSNPYLALAYAKKANELHRANEAVTLIQNTLKKSWDDRIVRQYGLLESDHINKQISHAESWLKKHTNNATLHLCLGRLCLKEKLWGKAKDYLNTALELHKTPETYLTLAQLYDAQGDSIQSLSYYRHLH